MVVIHGTQRFRARVPAASAGASDGAATLLGCWYATLLRWRPEVALFVNEATLLPVLVSLAPARTLLRRLPAAVADVLSAHRVPADVIADETAAMARLRVEPTRNRRLVGVMNEFGFLADAARVDRRPDLLAVSVHLAATPCGPLYRRHISPDRELAVLITDHSDRGWSPVPESGDGAHGRGRLGPHRPGT